MYVCDNGEPIIICLCVIRFIPKVYQNNLMNIKTTINWLCILIFITTIYTVYILILKEEYVISILMGLLGVSTIIIYRWIFNRI